jgi:restriction system protein
MERLVSISEQDACRPFGNLLIRLRVRKTEGTSEMPIPDFQSLMLPVLEASAAGEVKIGDVVHQMADLFDLTSDERHQLLPSGKQTIIANRTHWSKSYLTHAGLVQATKRGYFVITDRGKDVLAAKPPKINIQFLNQYPEFKAFHSAATTIQTESPQSAASSVVVLPPIGTPDEILRDTIAQIEDELRAELLDRLLSSDPAFFEWAVVALLQAMGYGGAREDAGRIVGKPGDGGIDGVIDEDALGLDRVYIQAKRYKAENKIGSPDVQAFYGAVAAAKAGKGVFVTTSDFSPAAMHFAEKVPVRLVLINGDQLTRLMLRYNVGVRVHETIYVKRLDEDFFSEE